MPINISNYLYDKQLFLLGVTLRKNYGSGFTFPLFLLAKKSPAKKSSTAIPHAKHQKYAVHKLITKTAKKIRSIK
jgi:hypothetical protein